MVHKALFGGHSCLQTPSLLNTEALIKAKHGVLSDLHIDLNP